MRDRHFIEGSINNAFIALEEKSREHMLCPCFNYQTQEAIICPNFTLFQLVKEVKTWQVRGASLHCEILLVVASKSILRSQSAARPLQRDNRYYSLHLPVVLMLWLSSVCL